MNKKGIKILKFLSALVVIFSASLYISALSDFDNSSSTLSSFFTYDSVPYLDGSKEVAINDEKKEYDVIDTYIGTITAYGPDCKGCVSGLTSTGYRVAEIVDGVLKSTTITYEDKTYGKLRILAAAPSKFKYGTVMRVTGPRIDGEILGIVLDTGGAMRDAWGNGEVLIDILFPTERSQEIYDFGKQRNVTFEVLRYGY
jgi:3D (Asp-Asp-Asp) domain-containing protein